MIKFWSLLRLFILSFFLFIFQVSFLNNLDNYWASLNIVIFFLIYMFIVYDFKTCLIVGFFIGFLFDLYSFHFFGLYIFSFLLTIYLVNFLWINSFTNRSLYSFLTISAIFSVFYYLILYLFLSIFDQSIAFFSWFNSLLFLNILKETLFILFLVVIFFYFFNLESSENKKTVLLKK